jgi:hypothetical protein
LIDKQRLRTFLLGGVAGALAGFLLAPRSGKELRGSLANRAGEARERGRETYFEAQERMAERFADRSARAPREERWAGPDLPQETDPEARPTRELRRPPLRDVSRDAFEPAPREVAEGIPGPVPDDRSEELRRRVQETRARLRARLEKPGGEDREE